LKAFYARISLLFFSSSALLFYSCSSSYTSNIENDKEQVSEWEERVAKNPNDIEALKNLSIYYVQAKQHDKARNYIDRTLIKSPNDPALIFYKGLNLEFLNQQDEALNYYKRYMEVAEDSPYKELLDGRFLWLKRQQAYSDIASMIKNEEQLSAVIVSDSTMAVFPLIYHGINKDYVPLSRGFSEMISIDLAKVKGLTILERVRIQAVLDEIKFSQSSFVDQSTAPRAGKLLKARTIISGDYDITENEEFKINLGSWDSQTSEQKAWVNKSGKLNDLFILQKEVVFAFLEKNGIELTQEEKESIAYIPTQNLQAFLSYSRGLLQEDAGNFKGAETFYQNAIQTDPNFNAAKNKLEISQSVGKSSGKKEDLVVVLSKEDPIIKSGSVNIVSSREHSLRNNISSNFVQGIDSRSPAQDQSNNTPANLVLPAPPPPPQK